MIWFYIIIFAVACFVLAKAGALTVKSLTKISQLLRWGEFSVAFLLMSFTTTFPELFVGITSALHGKPQLSFGNIIGSNVVHLTFVVALGVFLCGKLQAKSLIVQKTSFYTALIASLPILLMADKTISRQDGVILLLGLAFYFLRLLAEKERFNKVLPEMAKKDGGFGFKMLFKNLGLFLLGIALLLLAAEAIVWSSLNFVTAIGWSLVVFGILLLGLSTNLPEIVFTVKAAKIGHKDMILGDLMGAVAVNSGFVLGLTSLIRPIKIVSFSPYFLGIIFTILAVLLFVLFTKSGKEITKKEAAVLFLVYLVFVFWQLFV